MARIAIAALVACAFFGGMAAHAQVSSWGWWGTTTTTIVPISADNPLPVQCL
jgi:hypothetical protein